MDQNNAWSSQFGQDYTERNNVSVDEINLRYLKNIGATLSEIYLDLLRGIDLKNILEVGCNKGLQLSILEDLGYKSLYGIDIQDYAVQKAKDFTKGKPIYIIKGEANDIPFQPQFFDLVMTSGLLIHIEPEDYQDVIGEIYRVSNKFIFGNEYYSEECTEMDYRREKGMLWSNNFVNVYKKYYPELHLVKEKFYQFKNKSITHHVFLLAKWWVQ